MIFIANTEYTYPGGMRRVRSRLPTAADKRQIVQIAAIIYDEIAGEVVEFNALNKAIIPAQTAKLLRS